MSWKEIQIKDIGKVITGNTPPKNDSENYGGIYPFLKPTDMNIGERYTFLTDEFYSEKAFEKYKNSYIPPLSTCVVTIGTIGEKMCLTHDWCFTNQSVNSVIPNIEKYDGMFIFYLLKYNLYQVKYANAGTSSGREHVNKTTFSNIKVNVPNSIETQKRIASILATYDDLIENNLKRIKLLEETAQNIYKEWFVNFRFPNYEHTEFDAESGLPVGWEMKKLLELVILTMGQSPKSEFYNENKEGLPFHQGVTGYGHRFVSHSTYCSVVTRIAEEGDILFSVRAPVGRLNIAPEKLIIGRGLSSIRNKRNCQSFQLYQLKNHFFQEDLIGGGAIFNSVTKNDLENQLMISPLNEVVDEFERIIKPIDDQIWKLNLQNQNLKEARDILLPRLMNRTIEV